MTSTKNTKRHYFTPLALTILPLLLTCMPITLKHPALNVDVPSEWEDEVIAILSDSLNLELKDEFGKNFLYIEEITWYKINKTIPDDLKEFVVYYYEYLETKPQVNFVAIYNDGNTKNIIDIKNLTDLHFTYNLYKYKTGFSKLKVDIPDYSNIKYLRRSIKRRVIKLEQYDSHYYLRTEYPTVKKSIKLSWPLSYNLLFGLENKEGLNITSNKLSDGNKNTYTVECDNLIPIKNVNNKFPELWYAALFVSYPTTTNFRSYSWDELGDYYLKQINDSLEKKDTLFLDSISETMQKSGFNDAIINETFNFVKDNIRYYSSAEKAYGWIPRDPKTVFEKGYGDCKEMATILSYLLRNRNIKAWPTLVNSGPYQYLIKYPTLAPFDHVIVCVEKKDGQKVYLDATDKLSTSETSYYDMIDQKVLVLKENACFTDVIKPDPKYQNRIITESTIIPSSLGNEWSIKGNVQLTGDIAYTVFKKIKRQKNTDLSKLVRQLLKNILKINTTNVELKTLTQTEVVVSYSADFSNCVLRSPAKGLVFTVPSVYTPNYDYCDLSYEGNRYLSKIEQTDRWIIPEEFNKYNFSNLETTYGKGSWISSKNTVTRTYSCEFAHIDASERDKLKNFFNERSNFEQGIAWSK